MVSVFVSLSIYNSLGQINLTLQVELLSKTEYAYYPWMVVYVDNI